MFLVSQGVCADVLHIVACAVIGVTECEPPHDPVGFVDVTESAGGQFPKWYKRLRQPPTRQ